MSQWVTAADVRTFGNITGNTGRYSDLAIGSNILTAQGMLERETGRQFDPQTGVTKTFSTDGQASVAIPDLRTATSVASHGAALTASSGYWLVPDARYSGVYVGVQLRTYSRSDGDPRWWLANPEWFDRNLDRYPYGRGTTPDDLAITGDWGWQPHAYDVLHAVKVWAAWLTKRADALLANAVQNPDGSILDYSAIPEEVVTVIRTYRRGAQAVAV